MEDHPNEMSVHENLSENQNNNVQDPYDDPEKFARKCEDWNEVMYRLNKWYVEKYG